MKQLHFVCFFLSAHFENPDAVDLNGWHVPMREEEEEVEKKKDVIGPISLNLFYMWSIVFEISHPE